MSDAILKKVCNRCKRELPVINKDKSHNFSKRSASPDGYGYTCKVCERAVALESYHRRKGYMKIKQEQESLLETEVTFVKDLQDKEPCSQMARLPFKGPSETAVILKNKQMESLRANTPANSDFVELIERDSEWVIFEHVERFLPVCQFCGRVITKQSEVMLNILPQNKIPVGDPFQGKAICCIKCNNILTKGGKHEHKSIKSGTKRRDVSSSKTVRHQNNKEQ